MPSRSSGFPLRYSAPFLLFGVGLVGGGLAVVAGFLVSLAVFSAQRRLDATLQATEDRRERENLKMSLSMAGELSGIDLHGRDLEGLRLVEKQMNGANLEGANLKRAE